MPRKAVHYAGIGAGSAAVLRINVYDNEAMETGKLPIKRKKPKPLLDWDLGELLRVVKAAGWLPAPRPG